MPTGSTTIFGTFPQFFPYAASHDKLCLNNQFKMTSERINNLDILRALAALMVCLYHFEREGGFTGIEWFQKICAYGHYGVEVFFVISGYIIPLALYRSQFEYNKIGKFFKKRFLRLYPAYFLSILITVGLWWGSSKAPGFKGSNVDISVTQLISNITLTADLYKQGWILPVFWTLAIEAQYYLIIAFSYPFFVYENARYRYAAILIWFVLPVFLSINALVFSWTALFAIGVLIFLKQIRKINIYEFWALVMLAFLVHTIVKENCGGLFGLGAATFILYAPEIKFSWLARIGIVSYSLYLLHVPIGGRIINMAERLPEIPWLRMTALALAVLISILAAVLYYKWIENPSHQFARKI